MKIFRAVERGIEIPESLDDLVIPEKTEQKPENGQPAGKSDKRAYERSERNI